MPARKIDIHPHIVSPDTDRYPVAPLGGKRSDWSKSAHSLTAEQLIAAMDEAGIDRAAIVHSSTTYGFDNSLVVDAVAAHPDRLTAVCSIDALAEGAAETLRDLVEKGCTGLRFFTTGSTMPGQADWLNDPATYPVWEYASEIRLPICIQARVEGLEMLRDMMDRFPKVPIILDHMAKPDLSSGPPYEGARPVLDLADAYPQLTIKYTPSAMRVMREGEATPETFLPVLVDAFGAERIAWGSNYPASSGTLPGLLAEAEEAFSFLSASDRDLILGENAARLYPVLAE